MAPGWRMLMVARDDLSQRRPRFALNVENGQQRPSGSVREAGRSERRQQVGLKLGAEVTLSRGC